MKDDIAIKISHISKSFRLPHEKHNSLKDKAVHIFGPRKFTKFKALEDIDFEIKKGEFFGIVGKNGSGKSTLLKILANIYKPTSGKVRVNGSLAPFIELGVGFNPELTGRENVFLSGAILGLSRKKIDLLYETIVSFAELGEFMDQKLKNYSSGMQVRLAFSIAIRAESDILLIDEILAVGDTAFQSKCFDEFDNFRAQNKTIVLVTHDMDSVQRFCDRAALINDSHVVEIGKPDLITKHYNKLNNQSIIEELNTQVTKNEKHAFLTSTKMLNSENKVTRTFSSGSSLTIELTIKPTTKLKNIGVAIMRQDGVYCFGTNTRLDGYEFEGRKKLALKLEKPPLLPGTYLLKVGFFGKRDINVLEFIEQAEKFKIISEENAGFHGVVAIKHSWE